MKERYAGTGAARIADLRVGRSIGAVLGCVRAAGQPIRWLRAHWSEIAAIAALAIMLAQLLT